MEVDAVNDPRVLEVESVDVRSAVTYGTPTLSMHTVINVISCRPAVHSHYCD
jgi:hypothetical protein